MKGYITNKILSTFLIIQVLLITYFSRIPEWVEQNYSQGVYPYISRFLRRLIGWMPISIGDLVYLLVILFILKWFWLLIQTRFSPIRSHIFSLGAFLSIVFFLFHLLWGLNYHRLPLHEQMGHENLEFSKNELIVTTLIHIDKINSIHNLIAKNDSSAIVLEYKRRKIYKIAAKEYTHLSKDENNFSFKTKSIKSSLLSNTLSYMGFSGYLNPFTGEAQVNKKIPKTNLPATVSHEMAHQLGYASEDEANYIGYLACKNSDDLYFNFSGELLAVQHLLFNLAQDDKKLYNKYYQKLNFGIRKNIQQNRDFWDSYENPIEPYFKRFYDAFLKANNQEEGIHSYKGMVGYLVKETN